MLITILTTTYNRSYILGNLYLSLLKQIDNDFVWLIIDDGSTDDTEKLVCTWVRTNENFKIKYFKKNNGGKHKAINYAIKLIETEYVFIVDSDDRLTSDAIQKIKNMISSVKNDSSFAGVSGLRGFDERHKIGDYPSYIQKGGYIDANNRERRKLHLLGDKAEVYKVELLKKFPFPEFEGEKFLSECVVYNAISDSGFKIRWFNDIIYLGNYLNDGLTKNILSWRFKCFNGFTEETKSEMKMKGIIKYRIIGRYIQIARKKMLAHKKIMSILDINVCEYLMGFMCHTLQSLSDMLKGIM